MIQGAIFDMDGLMFDTEPIWTRTWAPVLATIGVEYPHGLADAVRGTSGKSMEAVINRFLPNVDAAYVREKAYEHVHQELEKGVPKKPGLDELLAYLASKDIPMAVASSSSLEAIKKNLANGGVSEYFGELFTGVGMAHPKPEPDIFLNTAAAMGVDPAHTLVFEDSLSGVRAGTAGGFITIMVPDMVAPDDFAREHAACICKDLLEVRDLLAEGKLG
ncbi:MAG: HAD family phosphatase [Coriobacteriales bacterium]|nr:HAD family phosphatase [Coriobacteriales bacterium]